MYILGGFLALGAFLDSVSNAISLLTPLVASIGTACIVLVWCLVHFILPSHHLSWVFGMHRMPVKKPGIQPTAIAVGMVLLLWMPSILPSPDKGIEVEKLDTIQKNTENTQQNVQKIVALLEQELSIKTAYIIFLQGQVERFQAQEPSPRARELAAQIPSDANPYALALKAIAERRFDDARRLLGEAQHAKEVELVQIYQARADTELYDGRYGDAVGWYERALALNPDDPGLLNSIGFALIYTGNYAKAETLLRQALVLREKAPGPEHPDVAVSLTHLALLYDAQGRYADAEPRFQRALAVFEKVFGPEHPHVAVSLTNLALLYDAQGRYADAEPHFQRALAIREKVLGPEHPEVAASLANLARLYRVQGRYADAEPRFQRALAIREKVLGPEHPEVAASLTNLALLYDAQGRYADAEPHFQRALAIREKVLGPEHPEVAASLANLARFYRIQGRDADAEPHFQRALAIDEKVLGPEHPEVAVSLTNLALLYKAQGRYADAEPRFQRALAVWEKVLGPEHPYVATAVKNYAALLRATNRDAEAEQLEARWQVRQPPRAWLGILMKRSTEPPGVFVEQVIAESAAAQAGIQPHDVIIRFNAEEVPDPQTLLRLVGATAIGATIDVDIIHNGQRRKIAVTLEKRPLSRP